MKNKISDLRNHMFAALERLSDETLTADQLREEIQRAQAISEVGKVIVDSAKTEVMFAKLSRDKYGEYRTSGFLNGGDAEEFTEHKALSA